MLISFILSPLTSIATAEPGSEVNHLIETGSSIDETNYLSLDLLSEHFSVSKEFLQEQLNTGYTLTEVYSALMYAELNNVPYEQAIRFVAPKEENNSLTATSDVYNGLTGIKQQESMLPELVTDEVYRPEVTKDVYIEPPTISEDVYKNNQKSLRSANRPPNRPTQPPVYDKTTLNQAPFSIKNETESISTMSGSLSLEEIDMSLPGRGGLSFDLKRKYSSDESQYYEPTSKRVDSSFARMEYSVDFTAVAKPILYRFYVDYRERYFVQDDVNGDGIADRTTGTLGIIPSSVGVFDNYDQANEVANRPFTYSYTESIPASTTRSSSANNFPSSVTHSQNGYSGTLNKSGSVIVSGAYTPAESKTATSTCTRSIPGKYDSNGNWYETPGASPACPDSKSYSDGQGFSGTLGRTTTDTGKTCPSPRLEYKGYVCTKDWTANYSGTVTKPGYDNRNYTQSYSGEISKYIQNSTVRYTPWASIQGIKRRTGYTLDSNPSVRAEPYEGQVGEIVTLNSGIFETYTEAILFQNSLKPGQFIESSDGYNYYLADSVYSKLNEYNAGVEYFSYYANDVVSPAKDLKFPLGKGWSWDISFLEFSEGKTYLNLQDGGKYEVENGKLKGFEWEGPTVGTDTSVSVNGLTSQYMYTTSDGLQRQYFTSDGRLIQIRDSHDNTIDFYYAHNAEYNRPLLSEIRDAIGNKLVLTYSKTEVKISNGKDNVIYTKILRDNIELLESVINPLWQRTVYSYNISGAKFNLFSSTPDYGMLNPYALLSKVTHPTGAETIYTYEQSPVTRYLGTDSMNEAYRILERRDQINYSNGPEKYNIQTYVYSGDMGASYGQNLTFTTNVSGLQQSAFHYRKDATNAAVAPQFYLDKQTKSASGLTKTTEFKYEKTVTGRSRPATVPTQTTESNNKNTDTLVTKQKFDDFGSVIESTDARGATSTYTYDNRRLLQTSIEQSNAQTRLFTKLTRNSKGDLTQSLIRRNDNNGEVLQQTDYEYDNFGNQIKQTFHNTAGPEVLETQYSQEYSYAFPTLQRISLTNADGINSVVETKRTYDRGSGDMKSFTDANGFTTRYSYDALGRIQTVDYPEGNETDLNITYDDVQNTLTFTNEEGIVRQTRWNALGMKISEGRVEPSGYKAEQLNGYDSYGRLIWNEKTRSNRTNYQYDGWDRPTITTHPDQTTSITSYDDSKRVVIEEDEEKYQEIQTMDKFGQVVQEKKLDITGEKWIYSSYLYDDYSGDVIREDDPGYISTKFTYNAWNQLSSVKNDLEETTSYQYDRAGQLTNIIHQDGSSRQKKYDQLGRVIVETNESGQEERSFYDGNGNIIRFIDKSRKEVTYDYDKRNRLKVRTHSDEKVEFTYDLSGKRTSMKDATGTTMYQYHPYTEYLKEILYPDGLKLQMPEYDGDGNRKRVIDPFGKTLVTDYDLRNRIQSVSDESKALVSYKYKANDLIEYDEKGSYKQTYDYSYKSVETLKQFDRTTLEKYNEYRYDRDKNLNITNVRVINNLSQESRIKYGYDYLQRIKTDSSTDTDYVYDSRGNRKEEHSYLNQADVFNNAEYTYDSQNRLTKATIEGGSTVKYRYNGENRMVEREENGQISRYYYDDDEIIAEATVVNGVPQLKARYIRGNKLERIEYPDGRSVAIMNNGHGDVTGLRDNSGVVNEYSYDSWGNPTISKKELHNPFLYSGEFYDETTGLQYLRARWYDPSIGRFLSEDTYEGKLTNPLSLNLYTYAENNPLQYNDPTGNFAFLVPVAVYVAKAGIKTAIDVTVDYASSKASGKKFSLGRSIASNGLTNLIPGAGEVKSALKIASRAKGLAKSVGKVASSKKKVHGNSHSTTRPAIGYSIKDRNSGKVLKYGETVRGEKRYTQKWYKQNNARMEVEANGTKKEMHQWQHQRIIDYKNNNNGLRPPLNKSDY